MIHVLKRWRMKPTTKLGAMLCGLLLAAFIVAATGCWGSNAKQVTSPKDAPNSLQNEAQQNPGGVINTERLD